MNCLLSMTNGQIFKTNMHHRLYTVKSSPTTLCINSPEADASGDLMQNTNNQHIRYFNIGTLDSGRDGRWRPVR